MNRRTTSRLATTLIAAAQPLVGWLATPLNLLPDWLPDWGLDFEKAKARATEQARRLRLAWNADELRALLGLP